MRGVLVGIAALFMLSGCGEKTTQRSVTVYVSEDRVFSEPVLQAFEKETGIRIRAVYDTEESKSTGVMNRILAESAHPQADVYWANEPIRAEVLRKKGVLEPYRSPNSRGIDRTFIAQDNSWTGFSARLRLFIVHKDARCRPTSVWDYADAQCGRHGIIANPLFGTTTSHIAALASVKGETMVGRWLGQMRRAGVAIASSNGASADAVADGRYDYALVDSDDAISRLRDKEAIELVYPDQGKGGLGVFVVPNAVMLLHGAPHPKEAKLLIDYLLSAKTEEALAKADCAQIPLHPGIAPPKELRPIEQLSVMRVDYGAVADEMLRLQPMLKKWVDAH
jgi:iron(III) transport system substrate-binding protein